MLAKALCQFFIRIVRIATTQPEQQFVRLVRPRCIPGHKLVSQASCTRRLSLVYSVLLERRRLLTRGCSLRARAFMESSGRFDFSAMSRSCRRDYKLVE